MAPPSKTVPPPLATELRGGEQPAHARPSSDSASRRACGGLTLVETLVAVTVAVVVIVLLLSSLAGLRHAFHSRSRREREQNEPRRALRLMAREVESACDPGLDAPALCFTGTAAGGESGDVLSFFAVLRPPGEMGLEWHDLCRVSYGLAASSAPGAPGRLLRWSVPAAGPAAVLPPVTSVLAGAVGGWDVSFADGTNWFPAWPPEGRQGLPSVVRMTLRGASSASEQRWSLDADVPAALVVKPQFERLSAPASSSPAQR